MKICLVTTYQENIFVPKGINFIAKKINNTDIVCVPGFSSIKRSIYFLFLLRLSELVNILQIKLKKIFSKSIFEKEFTKFDDINSQEFIDLIEKKRYDLIISYSCPQIFKSETINKINELNVELVNFHPGILPKYRGLFTNFYAKKNGEKEIGITFHKISKQIDSGPILSILKISVEDDDTIYNLYRKIYLSENSLNFVVNSIQNFHQVKKNSQPMEKNSEYNSYPKFIDILKYRIKN